MTRAGVYMVDYAMDGASWVLYVPAASEHEAKRRLAVAAQFGTVANPTGEIISTSAPGIVCWFKNFFQRLKANREAKR